MGGSADFKLRIIAEFERLKKGLADANKETGAGMGMLVKWAGIATAAWAGVQFVIKPVVRLLKDMAREGLEAIQIEQRLATMTRLWGDETGKMAQMIGNTASVLQKQTGMADDAYKAGAAVLLMSHKLTDDQLPKLMTLMGDVNALMGGGEGGLVGTGRLLAGIMEGGIEGLSRLKIKLTEAEQAMQEQLRATGREVEANNLIIAKMQATLGGTAAGQNQGVIGSLNTIKTSMSEIKETVGKMMLEKLAPLLEGMARSTQAIADAINGIDDLKLKVLDETTMAQLRLAAQGGAGAEGAGGVWRIGEEPVQDFTAAAIAAAKKVTAAWIKEINDGLISMPWLTHLEGSLLLAKTALENIPERAAPETPQWIKDLEVAEVTLTSSLTNAIDAAQEATRALGIEIMNSIVTPLGDAFTDMFMGIEDGWKRLIKQMERELIKSAIIKALQMILNAIGVPTGGGGGGGGGGGLIDIVIGLGKAIFGGGGDSGNSYRGAPAPVQVITADPTTMIRTGRATYGMDNRYVSSLSTRHIARELY